jgi:hypothetical protein
MHRVGFFVFPDHQILDLAGPFAVLEAAALLSGQPLYELDTLSRADGVVAGRGGVPVMTKAADQAHLDTLVICGGDISSMLNPAKCRLSCVSPERRGSPVSALAHSYSPKQVSSTDDARRRIGEWPTGCSGIAPRSMSTQIVSSSQITTSGVRPR